MKASMYQEYLDENFSGLDPKDIVFSMALPDPDSSAVTQVIASEVEKKYFIRLYIHA